jgi:hypothetical protein
MEKAPLSRGEFLKALCIVSFACLYFLALNKKFCGGPGGGFSKEPPGRRRQNDDELRKIIDISR